MTETKAEILAIAIFIILPVVGFALVKHQLNQLKQQACIPACQDSGKVSLEACRAALRARGNT